jgi:hypothetical protein
VRPELVDPVRDQAKLADLAPIVEEIFSLHESGIAYESQLRRVSKIVGRIIDKPIVLYAFGTAGAREFARRLLIDWDKLPSDLSQAEMLELLESLFRRGVSPVTSEYWVKCLRRNTGDEQISDLIYWPERYGSGEYASRDLSPAEILDIALHNGTASNA